jgi:hypothetical protein
MMCVPADFTFPVEVGSLRHMVSVRRRPHLHTFLERVAQLYEVRESRGAGTGCMEGCVCQASPAGTLLPTPGAPISPLVYPSSPLCPTTTPAPPPPASRRWLSSPPASGCMRSSCSTLWTRSAAWCGTACTETPASSGRATTSKTLQVGGWVGGWVGCNGWAGIGQHLSFKPWWVAFCGVLSGAAQAGVDAPPLRISSSLPALPGLPLSRPSPSCAACSAGARPGPHHHC